jgi:UDP-N-acetylmuramoyl-tripeptide--D-alanyl-D-alanine ligase
VLTLADAIEALTHSRPAVADAVITEAAIDSRQVIPGALFVAIPGERTDGHDFVADAFRRGASFALIQHELKESLPTLNLQKAVDPDSLSHVTPPQCLMVENSVTALQQIAHFWRRKLDLRVIGITGSVGKSTTKELIAEVLSQRYRTLKNPGNLNNEIGLPLTILRLSSGYERAVLEMGFYVPGEIAFLCEIAQPIVGVVTNVGTVHAERSGSQEVIAQGKSELVEALPGSGYAILNYDNEWVRKMAARAKAEVLFYGTDPVDSQEVQLWADDIRSDGLEGIRFRVHHKREILHVHLPLIGRHSVHNALAAMGVGLVEGLTWQEIFDGLQHSHTQLRLVAVRSQNGALLLDDTYNASPESTLAALNLLDELDGRKVAVLGDMLELGPYERQGHEMVGLRAAQVAETLITLGPRAHIIAEAARRAGMKHDVIFEYEELEKTVDWLRRNLTGKDTVLIKGSHGLHMDRIVSALEESE